MLTMSDKRTRETGIKQDSMGISNASLDSSRVNEEAIGIALTSTFKFERVFKLISSLVTNIVKAKYSSLMLIDGDTLRIKYSNHLPENVESGSEVKIWLQHFKA